MSAHSISSSSLRWWAADGAGVVQTGRTTRHGLVGHFRTIQCGLVGHCSMGGCAAGGGRRQVASASRLGTGGLFTNNIPGNLEVREGQLHTVSQSARDETRWRRALEGAVPHETGCACGGRDAP